MEIEVRFSPRALAGSHAGLDLDASSARYADALREAVARDFPGVIVRVVADAELRSSPAVRVMGASSLESERATERAVLDLAWVVKQCAPWSVP